MLTVRERYEIDPHFRALVDVLLNLYESQLGSGAGITPSEVREASGLAWQVYTSRYPHPMFVIPRCEVRGCKGGCGDPLHESKLPPPRDPGR